MIFIIHTMRTRRNIAHLHLPWQYFPLKIIVDTSNYMTLFRFQVGKHLAFTKNKNFFQNSVKHDGIEWRYSEAGVWNLAVFSKVTARKVNTITAKENLIPRRFTLSNHNQVFFSEMDFSGVARDMPPPQWNFWDGDLSYRKFSRTRNSYVNLTRSSTIPIREVKR